MYIFKQTNGEGKMKNTLSARKCTTNNRKIEKWESQIYDIDYLYGHFHHHLFCGLD